MNFLSRVLFYLKGFKLRNKNVLGLKLALTRLILILEILVLFRNDRSMPLFRLQNLSDQQIYTSHASPTFLIKQLCVRLHARFHIQKFSFVQIMYIIEKQPTTT